MADERTVAVPADALKTVLDFAVDDPALDFPPEDSDVPDALRQLEEIALAAGVSLDWPRYATGEEAR